MAEAPAIYDLELMTSPEVEAALRTIRCVLIPVGSCEQHGPNIALSSDSGQAAAYARLVAARMHPRVAVAPTIHYSLCEGQMQFAGSTTLTPETFTQLCVEVALSFQHHGIGRVLFVNGHGGNKAALSTICDILFARHGMQAAHVLGGELGAFDVAGDIHQGVDVGHACEFEVSSALHLCPELVREGALAKGDLVENPVRHTREMGAPVYRAYAWEERSANGPLGDAATGASAEAGRTMTEKGVALLAEFLEDFLQLAPPGSRS